METAKHFAETAMMIRKPISEVFNAFIDPEITTKFWFTDSSGKLEKGEKVIWTWKMFQHSVAIQVLSIKLNKEIKIQWGSENDAIVIWKFEPIDTDKTFITITNEGLKGTPDEVMAQIRDATGGFSWLLAEAKAYLEYNIQLQLIKDRYPAKQ